MTTPSLRVHPTASSVIFGSLQTPPAIRITHISAHTHAHHHQTRHRNRTSTSATRVKGAGRAAVLQYEQSKHDGKRTLAISSHDCCFDAKHAFTTFSSFSRR